MRAAALAVAALAAAVASCGADDRTMRPPSESQTTTTAAALASPSDGVGTNTEVGLQLTSAAFQQAGVIPDRYTCKGPDISPPLQWSNLPAGVTELAVVMTDLDADGFVHWLVTGIPPTTGGLAEGQPPEGAVEGPNSFGRAGWAGPCPPSGTHTYEFRLLALSGPPPLTPGLEAADALAELNGMPTVAIATLTATASA